MSPTIRWVFKPRSDRLNLNRKSWNQQEYTLCNYRVIHFVSLHPVLAYFFLSLWNGKYIVAAWNYCQIIHNEFTVSESLFVSFRLKISYLNQPKPRYHWRIIFYYKSFFFCIIIILFEIILLLKWNFQKFWKKN